MKGPACWGMCPTWNPTAGKPKEYHTEVSIGLQTDWAISLGFLLTLITYINPLFLSMLAIMAW